MDPKVLKTQISNLEAVLSVLRAEYAGTVVEDGKIDGIPLARIQSVGESAHLHLAHIEKFGSMNRADSLDIRRKLYGSDVRSTANQFGKAGSGAILHRDVPYGTKLSGSDPVKLTPTGLKIAQAYRALHAV